MSWIACFKGAVKDSYRHVFCNPEALQFRRLAVICFILYYLLYFSTFLPMVSSTFIFVLGTFIGFYGLLLAALFGYMGLIHAYITGFLNLLFLAAVREEFLLEQLFTGVSFHALVLLSATFIAFLTESSRKKQELLERLSVIDELTGMYNYRYFYRRLEEELSRACRKGTSVALIMLDLDHFKYYNDNFGHRRGDLMLRKCAEVIMTLVRNNDIVCRYGGDEFVIILPDADEEAAYRVASRLKEAFESGLKVMGRQYHIITLSMGIAVYPVVASSEEELIKSADRALYAAKNAGRNRIAPGVTV